MKQSNPWGSLPFGHEPSGGFGIPSVCFLFIVLLFLKFGLNLLYFLCLLKIFPLVFTHIMSDIVARLKEEEGQRGVTSLSKLNVTRALVFDSYSHILQGLNTDFLLAAYL